MCFYDHYLQTFYLSIFFTHKGLLQGAPYGVIRVGDVHGHYETDYTGATRLGASLKFFKDGMTSGDLPLAPNHSQLCGNFFEQPFTNVLDASQPNMTAVPDKKYWRADVIEEKFIDYLIEKKEKPGPLGLKHLATHTYDGEAVPEEEINFPFLLSFVPNKALKEKFASVEVGADLLDSTFSKIPPGTTLYGVYALAHGTTEWEVIGRINTRSRFTDTLFGDTQLRFSHEFIDNDLKENPALLDTMSPEMLVRSGCPFLKTRAAALKNKDLSSVE